MPLLRVRSTVFGKVVPTINQHFVSSYQRAFDTLGFREAWTLPCFRREFLSSRLHFPSSTSSGVRKFLFLYQRHSVCETYIGRGYPETVLSSIMVELYWTGEDTNKIPALDDYNMMQVFSRYYGLVLRTLLRKS
jgi:hypothetical protein